MKKKGIGFRIITMAVVISGVAAVIGCMGLYTTKKVSSLAKDMYQKNVLRVQYADNLQYTLQTAAVVLLNAELPGKTVKEITDYKNQFITGYSVFEDTIAKYESTNINSAEKKALLQKAKEAGKEYSEKGITMFEYIEKGDLSGAVRFGDNILAPVRNEKLNPAVEKLVTEQISDAQAAYNQSIKISSLSVTVIIAAILIGLAVSLTLAMMITRSITKPVTKMVNNLSESSSQIGISSTQLSTASQEIANGAQEQASSIEETTSSMEELSSMVKQNLGNTRQASLLSEKATEASQGGFDKMTSMLSAMNNISKSAEDIKNVIDVIDDIAFQTNMLALNAAVEAARAGEAGMGFAVVADEVKNLANRSSESAKETASMIKETLKNVEDGMTISKDLSETFKDILANSRKVQEMNKEVETASGQQDEGIEQVNKAMVQFDTVVQTNASSAEETAGAAEELQGQVGSLNEIVNSLYLIVSGKTYTDKTEGNGPHVPLKNHRETFTVSPKIQSEGKTAKKDTAVFAGTKPKQKDDTGRKENSHTISFEDDDDFKPV